MKNWTILAHLTSLNGSEVAIDESEYSEDVPTRISLVCQYNGLIDGPRNQIRWYFHHYKLNNNLKNFHIIETKDIIRNMTTSTLYIDNTKGKEHNGKYRCHYKGLHKVIRVHATKDARYSISSSNRLVHDIIETNQATSVCPTKLTLTVLSLNLLIALK